MKKRLTALLSLALTVCMLATGCGSSNQGGNASGGEGSTAKDNLIVAVAAEPKSLDPMGANDNDSTRTKHLIFDTLLVQSEEAEIIPGLAESWEFADDLTLNLKLREGVKFHNGSDFTASDVLYNLKAASESSFASWTVEGIDVANCTATDDYNVVIKLTAPNGSLLANLCYLYITDEQTVTEMGVEAHANAPVGTGAFIFDQWYRGDRLEFKANKEYWGTVASFETLIVRVIGETSSRAIEIESGGVDVALGLTSTDIENFEGNENVQVLKTQAFGNQYVGFNCSAEPFNNKTLRQAISYALDRESIVKAVYGSLGSVANGPMTPSIWGYNENLKPYEYNVEKAKELMKEAGYENGLSIKLTTSDHQTRADTAEIIQNQLGQIGITVEVEILENATYLDRILDGSVQMYLLGWNADTGDAAYALDAFYGGGPAWANTARYMNEEVNALLDAGKASTDPDVRFKAYEKAQELIVEDAPWVFLYDQEEVVCVRSNIQGLKVPPSSRYNYNTITFG